MTKPFKVHQYGVDEKGRKLKKHLKFESSLEIRKFLKGEVGKCLEFDRLMSCLSSTSILRLHALCEMYFAGLKHFCAQSKENSLHSNSPPVHSGKKPQEGTMKCSMKMKDDKMKHKKEKPKMHEKPMKKEHRKGK